MSAMGYKLEVISVKVASKKEAKALGEPLYFPEKTCYRGHIEGRFTRTGHCVRCLRDKMNAISKAKHKANPQLAVIAGRLRRVKDPLGELFRGAKARAKFRGIEFSIIRSDLVVNNWICPCCGREMSVSENIGHQRPESPSIDRVNPRLGYVPGNVAIICWRCNDLKRNATVEELRTVLSWMEQHRSLHLIVGG